MKQRLAVRAIPLIAIGIVLGVALTGCQNSLPLPSEERYQAIDSVNEDLDYQDAFVVLDEEYGGGDGVFGPTTLKVSLEGREAFDEILEQVDQLKTRQCDLLREDDIRCAIGHVDISMSRNGSETYFTLTDGRNGRDTVED